MGHKRDLGARPTSTRGHGTCSSGKTCYSHDEAAAKAKRHRRATGERATEYKCRDGCGWWHFGAPKKRRRRW